jgi:quercetin dioxygenase-like cupin family protein
MGRPVQEGLVPLTVRARVAFGIAAICFALFATSSVGGAQRAARPKPLVDAEHLRLMEDHEEPGPAGLAIMGDTSKAGVYVFRYRYAAGTMNPPHFHNQDRYVTVIKGTWWTGTGTVIEQEQMVPIRAGGFMFHPAGLSHYDGAREGDAIVQVVGVGPVTTTMLDAARQSGSAAGGGPRDLTNK